MKINLTEYSPSYERSAAVSQDADEYLNGLITEACGTDGLTFSDKSKNSSAKSLAHAGKMVPSSLVKAENDKRKFLAFGERFPKDADLIGFDDEVDARFKDFKEYDRTNELTEVVHLLNSAKTIPLETRNRVAKHVASIGGYTAYLTDDVAEKFANFALNYWVSKNPVLKARIVSLVDKSV